MKYFKKNGSAILTILVIAIVVITGIYNVFCNDDFFEVSIASLLTVLIAIVFSYWFAQFKSDKRKKNEKIDKLIYKIQDIVCQSDFISAENDDISRKNLIKHRSVANKITYLKTACEGNPEVKSRVIEIEQEFERLREFYGNHFTDQEYMRKSEKEISNYITKIDDKADEIHVMLL